MAENEGENFKLLAGNLAGIYIGTLPEGAIDCFR